jgi:hypothetical protein
LLLIYLPCSLVCCIKWLEWLLGQQHRCWKCVSS